MPVRGNYMHAKHRGAHIAKAKHEAPRPLAVVPLLSLCCCNHFCKVGSSDTGDLGHCMANNINRVLCGPYYIPFTRLFLDISFDSEYRCRFFNYMLCITKTVFVSAIFTLFIFFYHGDSTAIQVKVSSKLNYLCWQSWILFLIIRKRSHKSFIIAAPALDNVLLSSYLPKYLRRVR